ncbi:MAG: hypothetical protein AAB343_02780 [Patescibacteria group bacterium]
MKNIFTRIVLYIIAVVRAFAYIPVILLFVPIGYVLFVTVLKNGVDTGVVLGYIFPKAGAYDAKYLLTVFVAISLAVSMIVATLQEFAGRKIFIERQRLTRILVTGAVFGWLLVGGLLYWQSLGDETFLWVACAGLSAHLLCIFIARKISRFTLFMNDSYRPKPNGGV